jgi:glucan phosphoethanolaminetransferase (alkaline phosphatase superfamily)
VSSRLSWAPPICSTHIKNYATAVAPSRKDSSPNVLVVVLDSVRAANCSLYGAARETTPYLS